MHRRSWDLHLLRYRGDRQTFCAERRDLIPPQYEFRSPTDTASGLRRLGLQATELAQAQVSAIRIKLLKIGAQIRVTVRKFWASMASSYPFQDLQ
jgi:hypothetical protein